MDVSDLVVSFLLALFLSLAFMTGVFFIGKEIKRFDVVDAAWGFVFIVIAVGTMMLSTVMHQSDIHWAKLAVVSVVAIWGARLATHIGHRITRTDREDPRYTEIRSKWKSNTDRNVFVRIYMVQAVLATIVALPVIVINASNEIILPEFVVAGLIIWGVGFVIESIADLQLESSLVRHPGKLMTTGLWKYSRHPNYFGELMQWWGIGVMALSVAGGWFSIIGPLVLTFLILYVSGVPPAERRSAQKIGWTHYKRRTSVLVTLPPARH